jgi:hypothetical protein
MEFTLDRNWRKGLGTELIVLCTLLDYKVSQLNINKSLNNTNFEKYKKIFNISDDILRIHQTTDLQNEIEPSDIFKIYSPYYKLSNNKQNKRFIGIAAYQDSQAFENPGLVYPESKYYPIQKYSELYKLLKLFGWEVITLDSKDVSVEEKVNLISNYCECVIGYEGGIAHLCHMLDVPYIMFPWKTSFDAKLLHLDKKTFFLDSFDRILSWTKEDLDKCINDLHSGITNNELVNNKQLITKRLIGHSVSNEEKKFLSSK